MHRRFVQLITTYIHSVDYDDHARASLIKKDRGIDFRSWSAEGETKQFEQQWYNGNYKASPGIHHSAGQTTGKGSHIKPFNATPPLLFSIYEQRKKIQTHAKKAFSIEIPVLRKAEM